MHVALALLPLALPLAPQGRSQAQPLPAEFLRRHRPLTEVPWRSGQDLRFGDLDGDGDVDGVMGTEGHLDSLLLLWNTGHGAFRQERRPLQYSGTYYLTRLDAVFPRDLEGDGDVDLVMLDFGSIYSFLNDGTGQFSPVPRALELGPYHLDYEIEPGDLDSDGDLDVLYLRDGSPRWARNVAGGVFEEVAGSFPVNLPSPLSRPILVDLDLDGHLDVVLVPGPELLLNDGTGAFVRRTELLPDSPGVGLAMRVAVADADLDNDGDLILGTKYASSGFTLFLYRNDLPFGFV